LHDAIHAIGLPVVYHTCGGMLGILDSIAANGCDASETLSPPGIGGDIADPQVVMDELGGKVALVGGMDQINLLEQGTAAQIRAEVFRLFEGFGLKGGYILSACDHFFHTDRDKLLVFAQSAKDCVY
jgi:uroporphyrinogen-III decarboxylase